MKLRLMGSPDLIQAAAARLKELGISTTLYPCRNSTELRLYADIDDRRAAESLAVRETEGEAISTPAPRGRRLR